MTGNRILPGFLSSSPYRTGLQEKGHAAGTSSRTTVPALSIDTVSFYSRQALENTLANSKDPLVNQIVTTVQDSLRTGKEKLNQGSSHPTEAVTRELELFESRFSNETTLKNITVTTRWNSMLERHDLLHLSGTYQNGESRNIILLTHGEALSLQESTAPHTNYRPSATPGQSTLRHRSSPEESSQPKDRKKKSMSADTYRYPLFGDYRTLIPNRHPQEGLVAYRTMCNHFNYTRRMLDFLQKNEHEWGSLRGNDLDNKRPTELEKAVNRALNAAPKEGPTSFHSGTLAAFNAVLGLDLQRDRSLGKLERTPEQEPVPSNHD